MLKESRTNEEFEYQRLSPEEQKARGILGRLVGICADFINPTRNGRKYSEKLWQNVFNDPIMKEKIANHCCFGELGHPSDRTETDMSKIAICLSEPPTKGKDGKLRAVFDIIDTPNGRILKSLCDYGCNIGISSRGEGDLVTDYDGNESVDPDTYSCECWDAVLIPAVESARLKYVTESLDKKRYNKTLRESLQKTLDAASEDDRKVMEETLENLNIKLDEMALPSTYVTLEKADGTVIRRFYQEHAANEAFKAMLADSDAARGIYYRMLDGSLINNVMFVRLTDLADLQDPDKFVNSQYYPIYINGQPSQEWFKKGDRSIVENAINSGDTVIQYRHRYKSIPPRLLEELSLAEALELYSLNESKDLTPEEIDELSNWMVEHGFKSYDEFCAEWDALTGENEEEESNEEMTDIEILDEIAGTLEFNEEEKEQFIDDVKSGNAEKYADDVEEHCCDKCRERFKKMIENGITDENRDDINSEEETELAVDNNEAMVEELQKALKQNQMLEQKIVGLQEQLSVCYAKESKNEEEMNKYKNTVQKLAESSKMVTALQAKASKLEEKLSEATKSREMLSEQLTDTRSKLTENSSRNSSLVENINTKAGEVKFLKATVNKLTESLESNKSSLEQISAELKESKANTKKIIDENKSLLESKKIVEDEREKLSESLAQLQKDNNLQKQEYSQKIEKSKKIVEKYKKATETAVDKYIELQAVRLGSSAREIKNRLPESYNFDDIDRICEELQDYRLNMNSLPFNAISKKAMNENIKIKGVSSKNESILPVNGLDDEIDEDLMYLAGK